MKGKKIYLGPPPKLANIKRCLDNKISNKINDNANPADLIIDHTTDIGMK